MSARKPRQRSPEAGAEAELLRGILGVAAHDLGGLSSALSLRRDALAATLAPDDARALGAIADEARTLGRQLRALRGPQGTESLAPSRAGALPTWFRLIERFGPASCLNRGIALRGGVDDSEVTPEQANALTYLVLAMLRHFTATGLRGPAVVTVRARRLELAVEVTLRCSDASGAPLLLASEASRWMRYAVRLAKAARLSLHVGNDGCDVLVPAAAVP